MIKEAIGEGSSVIEAKDEALRLLGIEGIDEDDENIKVEVLQLPEKKMFGLFGGSLAKVKVYIEQSAGNITLDYLNDVLKKMGVNDIKTEITSEDEKSVVINIEGEESGIIIGKRGETLDSLQYLCGLVANQHREEFFRVSINTGDYREKREFTLSQLGKKLAFKAIKTRRNVVLEYMNPYERRLIHTAVQKVNGAISWSEGENLNRHVVIGVDPNFKRKEYSNKGGYNKGGYNKNGKNYGNNKGYNKGGYNKNRYDNNKPSYNNNNNYEKRAPKNEGENFSLYGKVEPKKDDSSLED